MKLECTEIHARSGCFASWTANSVAAPLAVGERDGTEFCLFVLVLSGKRRERKGIKGF
jgi:hypothetical protein